MNYCITRGVKTTLVDAINKNIPKNGINEFNATDVYENSVAYIDHELTRLECTPKKSKEDFIEMAKLKGAESVLGCFDPFSAPNTWIKWVMGYLN